MRYAQAIELEIENLEQKKLQLLNFKDSLLDLFSAIERTIENPHYQGSVANDIAADIIAMVTPWSGGDESEDGSDSDDGDDGGSNQPLDEPPPTPPAPTDNFWEQERELDQKALDEFREKLEPAVTSPSEGQEDFDIPFRVGQIVPTRYGQGGIEKIERSLIPGSEGSEGIYITVRLEGDRTVVYHPEELEKFQELEPEKKTSVEIADTTLITTTSATTTESHSEMAEPTTENNAPSIPPFIQLTFLSPTVAYQRKFDGEIICAYLGCGSKKSATQWEEFLILKIPALQAEVRKAKRLTGEGITWELKLKNIPFSEIESLAEKHGSLDAEPNGNNASPTSGFQVGDQVKITYEGSANFGKVGEIVEPESHDWRVKFPDQEKVFFFADHHLALVKRPIAEKFLKAGSLVYLDKDLTRQPHKIEAVGNRYVVARNIESDEVNRHLTRYDISSFEGESFSKKYQSPLEVFNGRVLIDDGLTYIGFATKKPMNRFVYWLKSTTLADPGFLPQETESSHPEVWGWKYEVCCQLSLEDAQKLSLLDLSDLDKQVPDAPKKELPKTPKPEDPLKFDYHVMKNLTLSFYTNDLAEAKVKFEEIKIQPDTNIVTLLHLENGKFDDYLDRWDRSLDLLPQQKLAS